MASTLQIVDTSGNVLYDLNDPGGTNSGGYGAVYTDLLHDPDWGAPTQNAERFNSSLFDGGSTSFRHTALTPASIRVRIRHPSQDYDGLAQALGELSRLLAAGCTMKWIPNGSSRTLYADIEPTETPVIFDGRELAVYLATEQVDTPDGVTLSLLRQPYFRGDELDPTTNILTNATLCRDTAQDGRPDDWSWSSTSNISNEAIDAGDAAFQFDIATAATRQLLQVTAASSVAPAEVWVMSGEFRVTDASYTNTQCQAMIEFQNVSSVAVNTATGTLATGTTAWQRISVSGTAGALVTKAQAGMRMDNTSATSATVQMRNVQFEKASTSTTFRAGVAASSNDPTVAPGRVLFFYNAGDAPAPVRCVFDGGSAAMHRVVTAVDQAGAITTWGNYGFKQAESMSQGTDTSTTSEGAKASGTGSDVSQTTFATNSLTSTRLTWTLSATELAGVRGSRWEIWVRGRTTVVSDEYDFAVEANFGHAVDQQSAVASGTLTDTAFYDFHVGTVTVPVDASTLVIKFYAQRTAGSGNFRWDFAHLAPSTQAGYHGLPVGGTLSDIEAIETDPSIPRVAGIDTSQLVKSYGDATGPVPFVAQPGINAVYVLRSGYATEPPLFTNDSFTTGDVSFYYSPRYHL